MGERNGEGPPKFKDQGDPSEENLSEAPVPAIDTGVRGDSSGPDTGEKAAKSVGTAVTLLEHVRGGDEQTALAVARKIATDPHDAWQVFNTTDAGELPMSVQLELIKGVAKNPEMARSRLILPKKGSLSEPLLLELARGVAQDADSSYMVLTDADTGSALPPSVRKVLVDGVAKDARYALYALTSPSLVNLPPEEKMTLARAIAADAQLLQDTLDIMFLLFPETSGTVWKNFPYNVKILLIDAAIDAPHVFPFIIDVLDEVLLQSMMATHVDVIKKLIRRASANKKLLRELMKKIHSVCSEEELRFRLENAVGGLSLVEGDEAKAGHLSLDSTNVGGLSTVESVLYEDTLEVTDTPPEEASSATPGALQRVLRWLQFWKRKK